jgi:hypothetical protein
VPPFGVFGKAEPVFIIGKQTGPNALGFIPAGWRLYSRIRKSGGPKATHQLVRRDRHQVRELARRSFESPFEGQAKTLGSNWLELRLQAQPCISRS